jgi:DNA-binding NtrC family response regulator
MSTQAKYGHPFVADIRSRAADEAAKGPEADGEGSPHLAYLFHSLSDRLGKAPLKVLVSETVGAVERHCIETALASTRGNRSAAAKMLGLSRQALYMKLARYDIGVD